MTMEFLEPIRDPKTQGLIDQALAQLNDRTEHLAASFRANPTIYDYRTMMDDPYRKELMDLISRLMMYDQPRILVTLDQLNGEAARLVLERSPAPPIFLQPHTPD